MQIISDIFIGIIVSYLSFTNFLANNINDLITPQQDPDITTEAPEVERAPDLTSLPSQTKKPVPDVLLKSLQYQSAMAINGTDLISSTTNEPIEALVNIFCTLTNEDTIRTTTGSGFFIDGDGVIMTNAHVAQFLLLEETNDLGEAECTIRTGNPAAPTYQAELLYIPPAWIQENSRIITAATPMGTGERDYALLYVSNTIDNSPLPAQFPALNFDTSLLPLSTRDTQVIAAGYPALPLLENGPSADLIPHQSVTTVSELYTFGSNHADVFSIKGSSVGAEGSSGGPVVNSQGKVIGVIVTRGEDEIDGEGSLRAITLSHIEQTILEETNYNLSQNLSGNLTFRSQIFTDTMSPFLLTILQQAN